MSKNTGMLNTAKEPGGVGPSVWGGAIRVADCSSAVTDTGGIGRAPRPGIDGGDNGGVLQWLATKSRVRDAGDDDAAHRRLGAELLASRPALDSDERGILFRLLDRRSYCPVVAQRQTIR